jgi:hypothetical protein
MERFLVVPPDRADAAESWTRVRSTPLAQFLLKRLDSSLVREPIQWETVHMLQTLDGEKRMPITVPFSLLVQLYPEHLEVVLTSRGFASSVDVSAILEDAYASCKHAWNRRLRGDVARFDRWKQGQDAFYPDPMFLPSQATFWQSWLRHNVFARLHVQDPDTTSRAARRRLVLDSASVSSSRVQVQCLEPFADVAALLAARSRGASSCMARRQVSVDKPGLLRGLQTWFAIRGGTDPDADVDRFLVPPQRIAFFPGATATTPATIHIDMEAHLLNFAQFLTLFRPDPAAVSRDHDDFNGLVLHAFHQLGRGLAFLWTEKMAVHGNVKESHAMVSILRDGIVAKWVDTDRLALLDDVLPSSGRRKGKGKSRVRVVTIRTHERDVRQLSRMVQRARLTTPGGLESDTSRLVQRATDLALVQRGRQAAELVILVKDLDVYCAAHPPKTDHWMSLFAKRFPRAKLEPLATGSTGK